MGGLDIEQVEALPIDGQRILRTDIAGWPLEWLDYRRAVLLYAQDQVSYTCGSHSFRVRGGVSRLTGKRTQIFLNSIIATSGRCFGPQPDYVPPLHNRTLFERDRWLCMYCGGHFTRQQLSCDHIRPLSQGGLHHWNNVVAACLRCNNHKAGRTPEQAGMSLLAVPFTPTWAEYLYLRGRRILADQMAFLQARFPRDSRLVVAAEPPPEG